MFLSFKIKIYIHCNYSPFIFIFFKNSLYTSNANNYNVQYIQRIKNTTCVKSSVLWVISHSQVMPYGHVRRVWFCALSEVKQFGPERIIWLSCIGQSIESLTRVQNHTKSIQNLTVSFKWIVYLYMIGICINYANHSCSKPL